MQGRPRRRRGAPPPSERRSTMDGSVALAVVTQTRFSSVAADPEKALIPRWTTPVRGVVHVPAPAIARLLWEHAERHGSVHGILLVVADEVARDDPVRRHVILDPVLKRCQGVEDVRPGSARAVVHPGDHEQTGIALETRVAPGCHRGKALVELDHWKRRKASVAESVVDE